MEDMNVPSDVPTNDRRAAIEAAFAQAETQAEAVNEPVEVITPEEKSVATEAPEEHTSDVKEEKSVSSEDEEVERHEAESDDNKDKNKEARAPQSWKPDARETWNELPESAKREITRREREIATTMQQTAEERRFAQEMNAVIQPYQAELRSAGVAPKAVVKELLDASMTLRRGDPSQRAKLVADIINHHGVDLTVLNDMLMNKASAPANDPMAKRIAQLEAAEQARHREVQERHTQALNKEIDAFAGDPKNEFFNDVAPYMISLLEKGQAESLADAYEKSIWANPETRKILTNRQNQTQAKLAAASSVKGTGPKGAQQAKKPVFNDRRAAIEAAFDAVTSTKKRF